MPKGVCHQSDLGEDAMKEYIKTLKRVFAVDIKLNFDLLDFECKKDFIEENLWIGTEDNTVKKNIKNLINDYYKLYRSQLRKQAVENFVNDIIDLRIDNIDLMLSRSELLGFDFYRERQAVIIEIEDLYKMLKGKEEMILQKFKEEFYAQVFKASKEKNDVISYIGNNRFLICKIRVDNIEQVMKRVLLTLEKKWDLDYRISIGDIYDMPGIEAITYSFRDADNYLKIGKRFLPGEKIYTFEKMGMYMVFDNLGKFEKEKILRYIRQAVEYGKQNRIDVLDLLQKYYENKFVMNKTAADTGISSSKIKEIFSKIREVSNLNPARFEDAIKFYIAAKIYNR